MDGAPEAEGLPSLAPVSGKQALFRAETLSLQPLVKSCTAGAQLSAKKVISSAAALLKISLFPAGGTAQGSKVESLSGPRAMFIWGLFLAPPSGPSSSGPGRSQVETGTLERRRAPELLSACQRDTEFIPLLARRLQSVISHRICHGITAPAVMIVFNTELTGICARFQLKGTF